MSYSMYASCRPLVKDPLTLVKDESCYGDIKNAQFCATTCHVASCDTKIVHFYVSIVILSERYLTKTLVFFGNLNLNLKTNFDPRTQIYIN